MLCETCLHREVCGRHKATGGVNKCDDHKEERHGRWNEVAFGEWKCSVCGIVQEENAFPYNYCPNCGTPMDAMYENADPCACCGAIIPEGGHYCPNCGKGADGK